ncbi:phage head closure protein [Neptuniibacter sp.]|uniref:phage head closure protein n=1 Tax=Neptuniibacter sp. TaxID=1962643 RepID=UPI002606B110|nr:phage head closure protein [Neptuniibacter sp.]MCP4597791.1 phage head closure protein [Neptuniibacter sp.]
MRAGRLNTRITVKQASGAQDQYGSIKSGPGADVATLWAAKKHISGKEKWASEHVANNSTVSFRVRYRTDIEPDMWVIHGSDQYQIKGHPIDPDGRRRDLIITCGLVD